MELDVYTKDGNTSGRKVEVNDAVFGADVNEHCVWLAVNAQMKNKRQGTRSTKTRGQVAGGGKKPWRQKGRGTARAGSTRSPIWVGGSTIFGPKPVKFKSRVTKGIKKRARISAFSDKRKQDRLKVVETFSFEQPKTKNMAEIIKSFGLYDEKTLVLVPEYDEHVLLASRNLKNCKVLVATDVSTFDLVGTQNLLIMEDAIPSIEEVLQ